MAYKFQLGSFTASGSVKAEEGLDAGDSNVTNVGQISLDSIAADNQDIAISLTDSRGTALEIKEGSNAFITCDTSGEEVQIGQNLVMAANKSLKFSNDDFIQLATDVKVAAAAKIVLDAATNIEFDADGGTFSYKDGGTEVFKISNSSGDVTLQPVVDAKDLIFAQRDGTEVMRIEDDASLKLVGGLGSSGVTVSAAGAISADGRIVTDDATNATTTTDGSIQTDGGLSVVLDAVIGDDLLLKSDSAVIHFGADSEVTLTHIDDAGLLLNSNHKIAFSDANTNIGHDATVGGFKVEDHAAAKIQAPATEIEASTSIQLDTPIVDFEDDGVILQFGDGDDVTLTHIHDAGLRLNSSMGLQFRDGNAQILSAQDNHLDVTASAEIHLQSANLNIDAPSGVNISHALVVEGNLTVNGTTTQVDTTNLQVKDKNILINDGGASNSAAGAGLDFEENSSVTGFLRVDSGDRAQFTFKAPGGSTLTLDMDADGEIQFDAAKKLTVGGNFNIDGDIGSTAAEINLLDGSAKSTSSITIDDADAFIIIDGATTKQIPASDLKTYLADNSLNVSEKSDGQTLANGVNFFASASANISASLPASPSVGDVVKIKAPENCNDIDRQLKIMRQGSHLIDGAQFITLESPFAAVECVYISGSDGNQWRVF